MHDPGSHGDPQIIATEHAFSMLNADAAAQKPLLRVEINHKLMELVIYALLVLSFVAYLVSLELNNMLPAQIALAHYAHYKAGDKITLKIDYVEGEIAWSAWGTWVNSEWLERNLFNIVPYFAYEGLTYEPMYPTYVVFTPYLGIRSFHVGGTASFYPAPYAFLNERYVTDPQWSDERAALGVLVHELIHNQGGNFMWSDDVEIYTSAATVEVLAAMCNYGDDVACKAFWLDIEGKARSYVRVQLHKADLDWLYRVWVDTFFVEDRAATDKARRYWSKNTDDLYEIVEKYDVRPWRDYIMNGVKGGWTLDTGIQPVLFSYQSGYYPDKSRPVYKMPYDDTRYLFGLWRLVFLTGYMR